MIHLPATKESACNAGNSSANPGSGRSPGGGLGNPLTHYVLIYNYICVLCAQSLQSCLM